MPALNPLELTLLVSFCALLLLATTVVVLLLRGMVTRMEDATATFEILREHPDLLREQQWTAWTGSVGLAPNVHGLDRGHT